MSRTSQLLSPLESIQMSWGLKLRDFKQWCMPVTQAMHDWKARRIETGLIVAKTTMADDTEAMLTELAQHYNTSAVGNSHEQGTSAYLPVLITALSPIETAPECDQVIGISPWQNVIVDTDPLGRKAQMRTMAVAYRCQVAFFAPDPHTCSSLDKQFTMFWKHEDKRTFPVIYEVGYANGDKVRVAWDFRVLENSLSADSADVGLENTFVATIDCTIIGAEPQIVGLGGEWDKVTDTGEPVSTLPTTTTTDPNNPNTPIVTPLVDPITGGSDVEDENFGKVVIEADTYIVGKDRHTRVTINPNTKVITQTEIKDD